MRWLPCLKRNPTQLRRACRSDQALGHVSDLALGRDALGATPLGRRDLGQDHSQTSGLIRASCPRNCVGLCISSFWNGLLFFFRPPAYLFAKKRTLNNELTKGGLMEIRLVKLSLLSLFAGRAFFDAFPKSMIAEPLQKFSFNIS